MCQSSVDYGNTQILHAYSEHLLLYREVGHLKRKTTLGQPRGFKLFETGGINTEVTNETSSTSHPSSSTDTISFSVSHSSVATTLHFFDKLQAEIKQSPLHTVCSVPIQMHSERWRLFLRQLQQLAKL